MLQGHLCHRFQSSVSRRSYTDVPPVVLLGVQIYIALVTTMISCYRNVTPIPHDETRLDRGMT